MELLSQKVYEAMTADIQKEQDQVWARHIQVADEANAQLIYDRLINGENFENIATEVYSGTGNISDMGWFGSGTLDSNAEQTVFNMKIGEISLQKNTEVLMTANKKLFQMIALFLIALFLAAMYRFATASNSFGEIPVVFSTTSGENLSRKAFMTSKPSASDPVDSFEGAPFSIDALFARNSSRSSNSFRKIGFLEENDPGWTLR
jgi:hypothetical protein